MVTHVSKAVYVLHITWFWDASGLCTFYSILDSLLLHGTLSSKSDFDFGVGQNFALNLYRPSVVPQHQNAC